MSHGSLFNGAKNSLGRGGRETATSFGSYCGAKRIVFWLHIQCMGVHCLELIAGLGTFALVLQLIAIRRGQLLKGFVTLCVSSLDLRLERAIVVCDINVSQAVERRKQLP